MVDQDKRQRPKLFIDKALDIFYKKKQIEQYAYDILEIGCMRGDLVHHVDITTYECCNDGHSSFLFARTGWNVFSVDINQDHINRAKGACRNFPNIMFKCEDALQTALDFKGTIGLLFLDAWDLDVGDSAQNHLRFFKTIACGLENKPLILIDDTDLTYDCRKKEYFEDDACLSGKGKLLIPELIKKHRYEVVFKGRQTLLSAKG